jgi:nucleoside-specific outer membrane channel protein Tsx
MNFRKQTICVTALIAMLSCGGAFAGVSDTQSTNIQILYGNNFELGPESRTIITIEHANSFKYGDNYFMLDYTTDQNAHYGEWVPRLSLSKMTGKKVGFGPIKDILLAGTVEIPTGIESRHAAGIGLAWDIPGFQFVNTNFFVRSDPRFDGNAGLLVLNWGTTWHMGKTPVRFEGYCDFQEAEGARGSWTNCVPRLLFDVGSFGGKDKENKFFLGFEFQHWSDKFGAGISDENVLQLNFKIML